MQNHRVVALLVIAVILASFLTYALASSPSTSLTLSAGMYPGAPNYTIFPDNGVYYAKSAFGGIDYYDADAETVIQDVLDSMTNGVTLVLTAGAYTGDIQVKYSNTTIEAYGATLTGDLILGREATRTNLIAIKGLAVTGSITIYNSDYTRLRDASATEGIYIDGQESEHAGWASFTTFDNVFCQNPGGTAFTCDNGGKFLRVQSLYIGDAARAFYIDGDTNVVTDLIAEGTYTQPSRVLNTRGNYYLRLGGTGNDLNCSGSWENNIKVLAMSTGTDIVDFGSNNIWSSIPVSPTYIRFENGGPTGDISSGDWVAHGLYGTPSFVMLQPTGAYCGNFSIWDSNSTRFRVGFDGGGTKTFYWYAEYNP